MEAGDVVIMTSCTATSTCKKGAKEKASVTYRANPDKGMVFLLLGTTTAETEHLLRQDGTVEALFKELGYIPDPALTEKPDGV